MRYIPLGQNLSFALVVVLNNGTENCKRRNRVRRSSRTVDGLWRVLARMDRSVNSECVWTVRLSSRFTGSLLSVTTFICERLSHWTKKMNTKVTYTPSTEKNTQSRPVRAFVLRLLTQVLFVILIKSIPVKHFLCQTRCCYTITHLLLLLHIQTGAPRHLVK